MITNQICVKEFVRPEYGGNVINVPLLNLLHRLYSKSSLNFP